MTQIYLCRNGHMVRSKMLSGQECSRCRQNEKRQTDRALARQQKLLEKSTPEINEKTVLYPGDIVEVADDLGKKAQVVITETQVRGRGTLRPWYDYPKVLPSKSELVYAVDPLPMFRRAPLRSAWWEAKEFLRIVALGPIHEIAKFPKTGVRDE